MNAMPPCPDELLVEARTRVLSTEDRARLDAHLARCAECRATLDVGRAFDAALGARPGDDEIARRIAARLTPRSKRRKLPVPLIAAVVFVTGSVAAASAPAVWTIVESRIAEPVSKLNTPALRQVAERSNAAARARRVPEKQLTPPASVEPLVVAPEPTLALERSTAAELFAEGNQRRRSGESDAARKAYEQLQRLYPGSTEALVSHVSLGRLERSRSPALALRHFDAYLHQSAHSTLAEEALFGKAGTLESLHRVADEQATWRELLRRFPGSVYAERARARLGPSEP